MKASKARVGAAIKAAYMHEEGEKEANELGMTFRAIFTSLREAGDGEVDDEEYNIRCIEACKACNTYTRFIEAVEANGYKPQPYQGRFEYAGPSITTNDHQAIMAIAKKVHVACAYDIRCGAIVVYPVCLEDYEHYVKLLVLLKHRYPQIPTRSYTDQAKYPTLDEILEGA